MTPSIHGTHVYGWRPIGQWGTRIFLCCLHPHFMLLSLPLSGAGKSQSKMLENEPLIR